MPDLFDLLSEKDKEKVRGWAKQAKNPKYETEIPPEVYTVAEAGHYWGWSAIEAILRGYVESKDADGKLVKIPLTTETVVALCKAEKKLRYRELIDTGDMTLRANISAGGANPGRTFEKNIAQYRKEAR